MSASIDEGEVMEKDLNTSGEGLTRVERRISLIHGKFRYDKFPDDHRIELRDIQQVHEDMAVSHEYHAEIDTLLIRVWMRLYALRMERAVMEAQSTEWTYAGICLKYRRHIQNKRRTTEKKALMGILTSTAMCGGESRVMTAQAHAYSACHTPSHHDWKATSIPLVSLVEAEGGG